MASHFPKFGLSSGLRAALLVGLVLPIATTSADAALTIATSATKNMSCSAGVCSATKANAVLNSSDLQNMLAASNVQVVSGSVAGAINVKAALSWASANTLTLDSYTSVTVDKPVAVTGSGGLIVTTDDGGAGGTLAFGAAGYVTFWSTSDQLTINGVAYKLVNSIAELVNVIAYGNLALANSYDAHADGLYRGAPINGSTFTGTLQGLGNTISDLTISGTTIQQYVGLFAKTGGGTIANLRLKNVLIKGKSSGAGGLVGYLNGGEVIGCSVSGRILGGKFGGANEVPLGGLVGLSEGIVSNSSSTASVTGTGFYYAGGVVGVNGDIITGSYASGSVSATGAGVSVGGLVGYDAATSSGYGIYNSYATGAVTGGAGSNVGGLVGYSDGSFENVGVSFSDSYSTGAVTGGAGSYLGGFIGKSIASDFSDNYWDSSTSGIANASQGCGNSPSCTGVTALTTSQLQSGLPTGFNSAIWSESANINGGLPYLLAIPPT